MNKVRVVCGKNIDEVHLFPRVPVAGDVLHVSVDGASQTMRVIEAYMIGVPLDAEDRAVDMDLPLGLVVCKIIRDQPAPPERPKRKWGW